MQQDGIVRQNKGGLMIIQNLKKLWHSSADQLSH
jgi:hypothetical protein